VVRFNWRKAGSTKRLEYLFTEGELVRIYAELEMQEKRKRRAEKGSNQ